MQAEGQGGKHTHSQIEGDKGRPPPEIFDEGAGQIQEEHVPQEMEPTAMDKHVGEERQERWFGRDVAPFPVRKIVEGAQEALRLRSPELRGDR